jgi:hypothetical protein
LDDDTLLKVVALLQAFNNAGNLLSEVEGLSVIYGTVVEEDKLIRPSAKDYIMFAFCNIHYLWVDLHCPLQQTSNAHIRGAAAEQTAQPCCRKEHHQCLQRMLSNHHNPVALPDTSGLQCARHPASLEAQLTPCYVSY